MLLLIPLVLLALPTVHAWGAVGHEIVATIAQMHLDPSVFDQICPILNMSASSCHLAPIAAWADRVRYAKRWSATMHYVGALDDHPPDSCLFPGERGWAGRNRVNVMGAISNYTGILKDDSREDWEKNEALKFLVHYVGDMHMPLHLTGRERGGNGMKVSFDGRSTNLHSVWDSLIISKSLRTIPLNYTRPLPTPVSRAIESHLRGTIYDPYIRRIIWEGLWGRWEGETAEWSDCPAYPATSVLNTAKSIMRYSPFASWVSPAIENPGDEWDTEDLCPYHWAKPLHALNCEIIWPKELDEPPYKHLEDQGKPHHHPLSVQDEMSLLSTLPRVPNKNSYFELDTPEYIGVIHDHFIVEKLLAQGGIRLASILNALFADEGASGYDSAL